QNGDEGVRATPVVGVRRDVAVKRARKPPGAASAGCGKSATMTAGENAMPQFVIEREIPGAGNMSEAELQAVAKKSNAVLKEMGPEIKWLHSYVTGDKVYCVYLAPDEETVREHARRGGFPANRVSAVRRLIDPGTAGRSGRVQGAGSSLSASTTARSTGI